MAGQVSTRLGVYRLELQIATGRRSDVFEAARLDDAGMIHRAAVKRFRSGHDRPSERIVDPLRPTGLGWIHPNIVRVLDEGHDRGAPFRLLELVDGYDLLTIGQVAASRGTSMPLAVACHTLARMLDALAFVFVGRADAGGHFVPEISLRRAMITRYGVIKVLGLGVPRILRSSTPPEVLAYFSPEEITTQHGDERSVLFALGSCFFEMMTGRSLFGRSTVGDTRRAVLTAAIPTVRSIAPDASYELDAALMGAMARSPEDRPSSLADFRRSIEDAAFHAGLETDSAYLEEWLGTLFDDHAPQSQPPRPPSQRPSSRHVHGRDSVIQDTGIAGDEDPPAEETTVLMRSDALARLVRDSLVVPAADASGVVPHPGGPTIEETPDELTRIEPRPPLDALLELDTTRPEREDTEHDSVPPSDDCPD